MYRISVRLPTRLQHARFYQDDLACTVCCRAACLPESVLTADSLEAAVRLLSSTPYTDNIETIFVIGGAAAFAEALAEGSTVVCDVLHLTRIFNHAVCDVHIPAVDDSRYALVDFQVSCCSSRWVHTRRVCTTLNWNEAATVLRELVLVSRAEPVCAFLVSEVVVYCTACTTS